MSTFTEGDKSGSTDPCEGKLSRKTDPEEFKKFHALLTRDRPDYQPFYFPLNPNSKDPLDNKSWKANRITEEQAVKYLEMGFNIGIAATDTDILVLMDADDLEKVGAFKPTLTIISRKRIGKHGYYFTKDKPAETIFDDSAKQNIATENAGEIRAKWQYVVCAGSYVPVSLEELERIPETDRANAGRYTLCNELLVNQITFNELPEVYRNCLREKRQAEVSAKIKKETSAINRPPESGKYRSKLWDLTLEDVTGKNTDVQGRFPSLFHGSETGKNNSISNGLLHCWRHNVSHTPLTALAILSGISDCSHAGYGHNGSGSSNLNFRDGKTVFDLWLFAKRDLKIIPQDDPIPSSALVHYGILNGTITKDDVIDGWKLPTASYNKVIQNLKKNGIDPGREEIIELIPKKKKSKKSKDDDEEKKSIGEISAEVLRIYPVITLRDNVKEMYFYENGVYKYGAEPVLRAAAQAIIGPGATNNKVSNVVSYIQNQTLVLRSQVNKEKHLINLKNGFYNLNTNTLEPHTPGILSTCQIPIKYDPAAKCPNISRFLCEILRPADIALTLQLMGYCLIPDYSIQKAFMWHGSGLNGKGTLGRLFAAYLGEENISNESLQALNIDRFSAANLYGKLANIDSDLSSSSVYEDTMFKRLTGGDTIPAERKFQDRFRFRNEARLIRDLH
jgi:putative DNA primase/helicase